MHTTQPKTPERAEHSHDDLVLVDQLHLRLNLLKILLLFTQSVENVDNLVCPAVQPRELVDPVLVDLGNRDVGRGVVFLELPRTGESQRWAGRLRRLASSPCASWRSSRACATCVARANSSLRLRQLTSTSLNTAGGPLTARLH